MVDSEQIQQEDVNSEALTEETDIQEEQQIEQVPLTESTKEDRQAFLQKAQEEFEREQRASLESKTDISEPQKPVTEQPKVEVGDRKPEQPKQQQTQQPQFTEEERQRLIARTQQQELFIQRRNSEYGEIKRQLVERDKQLKEAKQALLLGLEDRFHDSPLAALDDKKKIDEIENEITNLGQQDRMLTQAFESERLFHLHVDPSKVDFNDIAELLKDDGIPEVGLQHFKSNPFTFMEGTALIAHAKRAAMKKDAILIANYAKGLKEENAQLKARVAQLESRPTQVLNKVQQSLNQSPPITASNSYSSSEPRALKSPHLMTAQERKEFLKKNNEASYN